MTTPETLREVARWIRENCYWLPSFKPELFDAAAGAWEADRQTIVTQAEHYETFKRAKTSYIAALEQRLAEAEKGVWLAISEWSTWKDVLLSNMTESDWQETMDGLRAALAPKEDG